MSWPQWPQSTGGVPGWSGTGIAPAAPAVGTIQTPGTTYTPEQWAAMQQQNWQQWVQWQQQYQQWQQQYGEQYQKSLALAGQTTAGVPVMPVQPPLPVTDPKSAPPLPSDNRPPLPPEEPPRNAQATVAAPIVTYNANVPPPNIIPQNVPPPPPQQHHGQQEMQNSPGQNYGQNRYCNTSQPPPSLLSLPVSKPPFLDNQQPRNQNFRSEFPNKRPGEFSNDHNEDAKKNRWEGHSPEKLEQKQWNANQTQQRNQQWSGNKSSGHRPNVEELSEAEKNFDKQFEQWEAQFNKWKEQNAGHPDKQQYKEYEAKWESWRTQLLDRREQMRKKRLGIHGSPAQSTSSKPSTSTVGPPISIINPQIAPMIPPLQMKPNSESMIKDLPKQQPATVGTTNEILKEDKIENKENDTISENDFSVLFSQPPKEQRTNIRQRRASIKSDTESITDTSFLKTSTSNEGGIPGLDLVKDDDSKLPDNKEEEKKLETDPKLPDFEAISKGINSILGDEKLLNMLSMVAQNKKIEPDSQSNSSNPMQDEYNNSYQSNDSFRTQTYSNNQFGQNQFNRNFEQPIQNQREPNRDMLDRSPQVKNNLNDFRGPPNFNQSPNTFNQGPLNRGHENFNKGTPNRDSNEFNKFPPTRGDFGAPNRGPNNFSSQNRGPDDFGLSSRGPINLGNRGSNDFASQNRPPNDFNQGPSNNFNRVPNNFNQGPPGRGPNFNKGPEFNQGTPNRGPGDFNQGPPNRGPGSFNQGPSIRGSGDFNQGPTNRGGPCNLNQGPPNRGPADFNQGPPNRGGPGNFNQVLSNRGPVDFNQGPPNRGGPGNFNQTPPNRGPGDFNQGSQNRALGGPPNRAGPGDFNQGPPNRGGPGDFSQGPPIRRPGDFHQGPPNRGIPGDCNQGPLNRPGDFNQGPPNRVPGDCKQGPSTRGPGDFNQGPPNRGPGDCNQGPLNMGPGDFNQGPPNRGPGDCNQGPSNRGPGDFNQGAPNRGSGDCNQGPPSRGSGDFNMEQSSRGPGDFNPQNRCSGDFNQGPSRGHDDFNQVSNRGSSDFNQESGNRGSSDFNHKPLNRGPNDFNQGQPNRGPGDFNQGPANSGPGDFKQGLSNRGPNEFNQGPQNRGQGDFNQGPPNRDPGDFNQRPPNRGPASNDINQGPPNRGPINFNQGPKWGPPNRHTDDFNGPSNRGPPGPGPDHQRQPHFNRDQWNPNNRAPGDFPEQGPGNTIQIPLKENEQPGQSELGREDYNQKPENFEDSQDLNRNRPGRWSGDNFGSDRPFPDPIQFPNPGMRRSNSDQFNKGSTDKYWDEALILKPVTVVDYGHKSLNKPESNFMEPVQTFDYGHTSKKPDKNTNEEEPSHDLPHRFHRYSDPLSKFNRDYPPKPPTISSGNRNDDSMFQRKSFDNRRSQEICDRFSSKNNRYFEKSPGEDKMQYEDVDDFEDDPFEEPEFNRSSKDRELEPFLNKPNPNFDDSRPSKLEEKSSVTVIEDLLVPPGRNSRPARIVIILRGPPGSGKTFLAKLIKDKEVEQGGSAPRILSLDDYFMVEQDKEIFDKETGRRTIAKEMIYEYEECMELAYRQSLERAFKKTITDGFFPFIILDCVNDKIKHFSDMWSFAKQNGFQVYVCQMELDVAACTKRNIHHRSEIEIQRLVAGWEQTPNHYLSLDATSLIQAGCISDVEMEEVPELDDVEQDDENFEGHVISKWERMEPSGDKLARLDGINKPLRPRATMEDYLQLDDDIPDNKPGEKRVRWADLEERRQQDKMRAIGFVVGQTDWGRMMDPTQGGSALTQTKYIERVRRF